MHGGIIVGSYNRFYIVFPVVFSGRFHTFIYDAASHGIGTARAFQVDPTAGAFAGIGMALNAIFTAFAAPVLVGWLF